MGWRGYGEIVMENIEDVIEDVMEDDIDGIMGEKKEQMEK